jgi:hypothetical protein
LLRELLKRNRGGRLFCKCNSARHGNSGVAQDALGDVLVHANGGAQHTRAHKRHVGQLQQPLDRAVLAISAVEHWKNDVELRQSALRAGADQRALDLARHQRQRFAARARCEFRSRRCRRAKHRCVAHVPLARLVDADQGDVEFVAVDRVENIASRLQRYLVLHGFPAE